MVISVGGLSGPLLLLVLALIVEATASERPAWLRPEVGIAKLAEALARRLTRPIAGVLMVLLPALLAGPALLLLGWLNVPDLIVLALSVWLLRGCLTLAAPDAEALARGFVAPLFYYALFGVPGALFYRALDAMMARLGPAPSAAPAGLHRLLTFVPAQLARVVLHVARAVRGTNLSDGRTVRLAAWIAAGAAALTLYPRHGFLV
ncbi:MAG TPA: cobalamin biosynthesis protein [Polyangia bacterium]|nr:cobalamin biosynthesis protein [Polyangia bacterium]